VKGALVVEGTGSVLKVDDPSTVDGGQITVTDGATLAITSTIPEDW